jgi:hypothetical protein
MDNEFLSKLYKENLKMYAASQRQTTRLALCKIVNGDINSAATLLKMIKSSIYSHTKQKDN